LLFTLTIFYLVDIGTTASFCVYVCGDMHVCTCLGNMKTVLHGIPPTITISSPEQKN